MSLAPQVASHTIPHCSPRAADLTLGVAKVREKFARTLAGFHLAAKHTCAGRNLLRPKIKLALWQTRFPRRFPTQKEGEISFLN